MSVAKLFLLSKVCSGLYLKTGEKYSTEIYKAIPTQVWITNRIGFNTSYLCLQTMKKGAFESLSRDFALFKML